MTVNTGNEKLDDAYKRMQVHICSFNKVDEFVNYFNSITKDSNKDELLSWFLKVLFWEFKYGRECLNSSTYQKHPFDMLLERVKPSDKATLEKWLKDKLDALGI